MSDETQDRKSNIEAQDREERFFFHINTIGAIDDSLKEIREKRATARKIAKADGFDLGVEIDFGLKIRSAEDESIFPVQLLKRFQIAKWFRLPLNHQMDLFGDVPDASREPAVDKAHEMGVMAGLMGKNPTSPHDLSTPQGQAWMAGWHAGQERIRNVAQKRMEAANAEKKAAEELAAKAAGGAAEPPAEGDQDQPADQVDLEEAIADRTNDGDIPLGAPGNQESEFDPTAVRQPEAGAADGNGAPATTAKRGRGRPPGSKNKNKQAAAPTDDRPTHERMHEQNEEVDRDLREQAESLAQPDVPDADPFSDMRTQGSA